MELQKIWISLTKILFSFQESKQSDSHALIHYKTKSSADQPTQELKKKKTVEELNPYFFPWIKHTFKNNISNWPSSVDLVHMLSVLLFLQILF